jgi:alpha-tubulin suppressor-like RCC1 family protein
MPTFYNFRENGVDYSFDDVFVPADTFRDGNLWIFGWQVSGAMGNGQISDIASTPVTTFGGGSNWKKVPSTGGSTDSQGAIKTDGTLWIWGFNSNSELPNNASGDRSTPVTSFSGGNNWKSVSVGANATAIKTDGTLWVWGNNFSGRLGTNDTIRRSTPVTTFAGGTNWKTESNGCAIKTDGTLWVWGLNSSGRLGNAVTTNVSTPVTTFAGGTNWKQVSAGDAHTAAIKTDGTLWSWGQGSNGKLGNNATVNTLTPVTTFAGGTNWKQVSCGSNHTVATKTDGTLWVWGLNSFGRLGNSQVNNRSTPVTTFAGGNNWKQVSAGDAHTAAIKTDGTLWVWGYGVNGQLGNAATVNVLTPITTILGGNDWKETSAQRNQTMAVKYIDSVL